MMGRSSVAIRPDGDNPPLAIRRLNRPVTSWPGPGLAMLRCQRVGEAWSQLCRIDDQTFHQLVDQPDEYREELDAVARGILVALSGRSMQDHFSMLTERAARTTSRIAPRCPLSGLPSLSPIERCEDQKVADPDRKGCAEGSCLFLPVAGDPPDARKCSASPAAAHPAPAAVIAWR
jgi:hypothetical protein